VPGGCFYCERSACKCVVVSQTQVGKKYEKNLQRQCASRKAKQNDAARKSRSLVKTLGEKTNQDLP